MDPSFPISGPAQARTLDMPKPGAVQSDQDARTRKVAEEFEAAFLAEMLKYTGINRKPDEFSGGAGEDAFSSLLTQEYASLLAARGGIGLAEQIFEVLKQRTSEQ